MNIDDILKDNHTDWVRFSDYEYKLDGNGEVYIVPTENSQISIYNPTQNAENLLIDALNIGGLANAEKPDMIKIKSLILSFCRKYGLLGFMVSFPLSMDFLEKKDVLLGSNPLTEKNTMKTSEYLKLFIPFNNDVTVTSNAVSMGDSTPITMFMDKPLVYEIVFSQKYAEKLDWILEYFKELFMHFGACFYYGKSDNETLKTVYTSRINSFKLYNLGFKLKMIDKPTVMWEFDSLKIAMDTIYAFMVASDICPLRICKHCGNVFTASHVKTEFCSPQCRNQYNVYKSRGKE